MLLVVFVIGVAATGQELPVPAEEALDSPGTPMALFIVAAIGEVLLVQNTYSTMAVILLSLGSILAGTVMLSSAVFGRPIAYVTIAAGVFSVFTPFIVILGGPVGIAFIGLALGGCGSWSSA